jgi:hypothetical protein
MLQSGNLFRYLQSIAPKVRQNKAIFFEKRSIFLHCFLQLLEKRSVNQRAYVDNVEKKRCKFLDESTH